jgi:diguanylate cyclase (GGDEF)-like protein
MQPAADLLGSKLWIALLPVATLGVGYGWPSVDARRAKVAFGLSSPDLDQLTGLPTRRHGSSVVERHLQRGAAGAVVLCDVDDLRGFNFACGYVVADRALQAVAGSLRSVLAGRAGSNGVDRDGVFRLGGDEFLVPLCGSDAGTAVALAEEARSEVKRATANLHSRSSEGRPLTGRFAVAAWAEGSAPRFDALMVALENALDNAGPDVVVLVDPNES